MTLVKVGKASRIDHILDSVVDGVEPYGFEDFRHLLEVMAYTIQRNLLRTSEAGPSSWGVARAFRERLHRVETLGEFRTVVAETLHECATRFGAYRSRKQINLVERVKRIVLENVSDPALNPDRIAQLVGLSTNYLRSVFRTVDGGSLSGFITSTRLARCRDLLEHSDRTIKEIHSESGFVSYNYFFEVFKREVGMTPGQYRDASHASRASAL
jgi:AraC-like DNA-binding protein